MSSPPSSPNPRTPPLTRGEANEVLRYWLASLQLDEALATRPRARRLSSAAAPARVDAPTPGQDYFKLAFDAELQALLSKRGQVRKPFDAELSAFFEHWLVTQYRRGPSDERAQPHLLAFPVVHLPRGELAGLLRYELSLRFAAVDGGEFAVPTRSQRRKRSFPLAPNEVVLASSERGARGERQLPFFIDTRLLQQQLGVARESIDAMFVELRKQPQASEQQMLEQVCLLLEAELGEAASPKGELLERLTAAMSGLLARRGGRARVYPVGIVIDGTRAKTTWYLQRELQTLLDEEPETSWMLDSCLGAYLTGGALPAGRAVQRTLFPGLGLSESQRAAGERCWGSRLLAVQGPPGTGKTTLILHLAAQTLLQQVDALADTGEMGEGSLVVASTNNRAVDNVVDPLLAVRELPLALRGGSQKVCEVVLSQQLARVRSWLEQAQKQPDGVRSAQLEAALERFKRVRAELDDLLAPRARAFEQETRRENLGSELAQLLADEQVVETLDPRALPELRPLLERAQRRLEALCELCEELPDLPQLSAVDRHYRSSAKRTLPALEQAAAAAGISLELGLPPDLPPTTNITQLMEAWRSAAEKALAAVEQLQQRIEHADGARRRRDRLSQVQRALAALGPLPELAEHQASESAQRALFDAALDVREAWAAVESSELLKVVTDAFSAASDERSLRTLWESRSWQRLRQLFGVWGCTLLSLGNCFPPRREAIRRLVIDEAGQCHPAYAVSGLLRCESALIIGDVHQLEPVIELEPDDDARVIASCKLTLPARTLAPYRVHSESHTSVQSLADRAVVDRPQLSEHFRCQPEIIDICDALCDYRLRVLTPPQQPMAALPFLRHPVSLVDVAGEQERLAGSWHNAAELALTIELFLALCEHGIEPSEIAVITPYRGQLEQLRRQFARLHIPVDHSVELSDFEDLPLGAAGRGAALGTVHRFQGGERSIVLFSSVVTRRPSLGFLDERENLLNVAISRARHRFIALGHRPLLETGQRTRLLARAALPLAPEAFRRQLGLQL
ncbi:MAG TPA: AAA domain-containing protein [Polyangiales bacterium]|nr:AAA domain-containing protein [Polyangiales bacterium]